MWHFSVCDFGVICVQYRARTAGVALDTALGMCCGAYCAQWRLCGYDLLTHATNISWPTTYGLLVRLPTGTVLQTLLGIYIYGDLEGTYLKLLPEGADPNPDNKTVAQLMDVRRGQGASVIIAACIYLLFVIGCGGLWARRRAQSRVHEHSI